jgi:hypothetical protein
MSIEKKSLINTLKTTKKANIVKEDVTVSGTTVSPVLKAKTLRHHPVRKLSTKKPVRKS